MFLSSFKFGNRELELKSAKYAFVGIPYDSSETYRSGAKLAPNAIREASREIEDYDAIEEFDLLDLKICDVGNVEVSYTSFTETAKRVEITLKDILETGKIPVAVGGEHTISYCVVNAYRKKPFYLVFDAHMDFREEYMNNRFSHACTIRRIGELVGYENVLLVGVRSASKEEYKDARKAGLNYVTIEDYANNPAKLKEAFAEIPSSVYLSIDMDVFDPKEARGVCNPEPPGFMYDEFLQILDFLKKADIAGFDLTEVSPIYDSYTPILAAKLIFKVLLKNES